MSLKVDKHGDQYWRKDGMLHRDDGPAVIYTSGWQLWYRHGNKHRLDGPAIITNEFRWYVDGTRCYSNSEFQKLAAISNTELTLLVLKYGEIQ